MSDPTPCNLYTACFEATFEITVAAPVDMPVAEVRALISRRKDWVIDQETGRFQWTVFVPSPDEGDASETDRHTWIVSDSRQDLVQGEETLWLPESG